MASTASEPTDNGPATVELITPTRADLKPLTIPQLKHILRERGLRVGGSKFDLTARILEAGIQIPVGGPVLPPRPPSPPRPEQPPHPNLSFPYEPGTIYVAIPESIYQDYLFLRVDSRTKGGNIRFSTLKSVPGPYITNTPLDCSYPVTPDPDRVGKQLVARKQKINGWGVHSGHHRYYISKLYNPEKPYIISHYY